MSLKVFIKNFIFLISCYAPFYVLYKFSIHYLFTRKIVKKRYEEKTQTYKSLFNSLNFSNDWFSGNIPYWLSIFDKYSFYNRKLNILEIGSWEGMSSLFILTELPNATLTAVDTWSGSDEHQGKDVLSKIESNFDSNLSRVSNRLNKYKGTSYQYFNDCQPNQFFDLIFIDGSHFSDDVLIDGVKSFQHLKLNGIMIFDDYFWRIYGRDFDNPCVAINSFLRLKKDLYRVINVYGQIAIEKIGEEGKLN